MRPGTRASPWPPGIEVSSVSLVSTRVNGISQGAIVFSSYYFINDGFESRESRDSASLANGSARRVHLGTCLRYDWAAADFQVDCIKSADRINYVRWNWCKVLVTRWICAFLCGSINTPRRCYFVNLSSFGRWMASAILSLSGAAAWESITDNTPTVDPQIELQMFGIIYLIHWQTYTGSHYLTRRNTDTQCILPGHRNKHLNYL